jgi:hypothetical protein
VMLLRIREIKRIVVTYFSYIYPNRVEPVSPEIKLLTE